MWLLFSLFSILAWSGSDLFSKLGSRPDDSYSHWKMVMAVGLVMGAHAIFEMTIGGVDFDWNSVMIYLPVSALYILSMIFGLCQGSDTSSFPSPPPSAIPRGRSPRCCASLSWARA